MILAASNRAATVSLWIRRTAVSRASDVSDEMSSTGAILRTSAHLREEPQGQLSIAVESDKSAHRFRRSFEVTKGASRKTKYRKATVCVILLHSQYLSSLLLSSLSLYTVFISLAALMRCTSRSFDHAERLLPVEASQPFGKRQPDQRCQAPSIPAKSALRQR